MSADRFEDIALYFNWDNLDIWINMTVWMAAEMWLSV